MKEIIKGFLENYLRNDQPIFDFYYSEYPMGAVHSRSFMKIDGIWCVVQNDYDRNPPSQEEKHPEINDDNLAESFIKLLIKEKQL